MRNTQIRESTRTFLFLISYFLFLILLSSCSIQKELSRSAKETVLSANVLKTAHVGISIYEPAKNQYWFNYQGDHYFVPASNTKLPTCYAALKYLGDSLVGFRYAVNGSTINILPTGDPTFLHPDFPSARALDLIRKYGSASLYANNYYEQKLGSGWSWNDYQETYMAERSSFPMYGNLVAFSLENGRVRTFPHAFETIIPDINKSSFNKIKIFRPIESNAFRIEAGDARTVTMPFSTVGSEANSIPKLQAILLADTVKISVSPGLVTPFRPEDFRTFHSQPTDSLLKPMMHRSDNFFAEQSLLMVSNEKLGFMSDEKIIDTLLKTDLKDLPQKPRWVDGSGLSRYNLFSPQDFVMILDKIKNEFGMPRMKNILATGGTGTISSYYKADSGYIYAKTGTLSGVVALSGYLYTKKNKLLIFSVLVNNQVGSVTELRRAVEKFIEGVRNKY